MAKLSAFKSDLAREKTGVWVAWELGIRFRIARMNNPAYDASILEIMRPHRDKLRRGVMEQREIERLSVEAVARHILIDWENVEDDAGNAIPYSAEKAVEILSDPQYRDVYEFVLDCSRRSALFRVQEREEDLGNSDRSSSGTSPSGTAPSS